ncbi:Prolyl aminopeptidase [Nocardia seriolae]|uniref:prolyl aminopeptidase n=1 Tax=Nocardia seriolae TaxID=37332 RepID=A0ABC8B0M0_9NOCA|nr:alpha/beta fold hydrolase [Nocardia seriolae]APB00112.1 Prolyl aminopeptidase [Nocardia seriolae]
MSFPWAFAPIEPFASGMLAVGDGQEIYWETSGNPQGKTALYLHGGPGGGMGAGYRRHFDPDRYLIVGFEQRGCGRSRPLATGDPAALGRNTTHHLIADIEALRTHLGVDKWLVNGVSWGTTLALAYAQARPARVSELVLMATTLTNPDAVEWITETVGRLFPREWDAFRAASGARPGRRLVDAYYELLTDPDEEVRNRAVDAWMAWEDAHISMGGAKHGLGDHDPVRRRVFATLVVHYWKHAAFLPPTALTDAIPTLHHLPAVFIQGKLYVSGPAAVAWTLHKSWPRSQFILIDDEAHGGPQMAQAMIQALSTLAPPPIPFVEWHTTSWGESGKTGAGWRSVVRLGGWMVMRVGWGVNGGRISRLC